MKKRIFSLLLGASFITSLTAGCLSISAAAIDEHSVAAIQERGTISFATESAYAPYAFKDTKGNIVGFEVSIMEEIAKELDVELEIKDMAFDSVIPSVQSGLADVGIAALTPTEERKEALNMTDLYWEGGQKALVRVEDAEKYAEETSMEGIVVGAQKGSYQQQVVEKYYADKCTTRYLEAVPVMVADLKAANVDVLVMDSVNAIMYAQENDDLEATFTVPEMPGETGGNSMAILKGNDDLTDFINELLEKWWEDGTLEKWFDEAVSLQVELEAE